MMKMKVKQSFGRKKRCIQDFSSNGMRVVTEFLKDRDYHYMATYHVNFEISESHHESFFRPLRDESEEYLRNVGEIGEKIVRELFEIPGIIVVTIESYGIEIHKGRAFEWKNITSSILDILKESWEIIQESEEVNILPEDDKKELSENEED